MVRMLLFLLILSLLISSGITLDTQFCCKDFFLDRTGLAVEVDTGVADVGAHLWCFEECSDLFVSLFSSRSFF